METLTLKTSRDFNHQSVSVKTVYCKAGDLSVLFYPETILSWNRILASITDFSFDFRCLILVGAGKIEAMSHQRGSFWDFFLSYGLNCHLEVGLLYFHPSVECPDCSRERNWNGIWGKRTGYWNQWERSRVFMDSGENVDSCSRVKYTSWRFCADGDSTIRKTRLKWSNPRFIISLG